MEKNDILIPTVESRSILGKLYREVNIKEYFESCMISEHKFSIYRKYKINERIVEKDDTGYHHLLIEAYDEIVRPFREELVKIMVENNIINEAELYCSDFTFRTTDDSG